MEKYERIPLSKIKEPEVPIRSVADEEKFLELVYSIQQHGVLEPIVVRPVDDKFEIVAGHRRFLASRSAGLDEIPAVIRDMDGLDVDIIRLEENLKREDISPLDEAKYFQWMIEEHNLTHAQIAEMIGKSRSYVSHRLRLLNLPRDLREAVEQEEIAPSVALVLNRIEDDDDRAYYLHYAKEQGVNVRTVERWAADWQRTQSVMEKPEVAAQEVRAMYEAQKSAWRCRYCDIEGHEGYLISIWVCDKCLDMIDRAFTQLAEMEK